MNRISRNLILAVAAIAMLFAPGASAQNAPQTTSPVAPQSTPQKETRLKLAEGEYQMQFTSEGEDFHMKDVWTLWLTSEGTYELEEVGEFTVGQDRIPYKQLLILSASFRPISSRFEAQAEEEGESRIISGTMQFDATELRVQAAGQTFRFSAAGPHEVVLPLPWFMGRIALSARENSNRDTKVRLLMPDVCHAEGSEEEHEPLEMAGLVRFLGRGFVHINGTTWHADKYELTRTSLDENEPSSSDEDEPSSMIFWLSDEGILLAVEVLNDPELKMELIRYKQYRDFAPASAPETPAPKS
jgi:hypothetical protein